MQIFSCFWRGFFVYLGISVLVQYFLHGTRSFDYIVHHAFFLVLFVCPLMWLFGFLKKKDD